MDEIVGFEVDSDDLIGAEDGFLAIRRLRLRNRRSDGSHSEQYLCDFIVRPYGVDAVVVVLYHRTRSGVQVLLRRGLRPPLAFGRSAERVPVAESRSYMYLTEVVAGIIEAHDRGIDGIRRRAAEETLEEAGYRIESKDVVFLGQAVFPSPGAMAEKFWLTAVEVKDPSAQISLCGDGSPMEEGATTEWLDLDRAIAACVRGDIEDCKTELALRRLRDLLQTQSA
ncbi:MAG: NUDIX hydrolase [Proteobacteria bacterium]|nr:NUDIX hydrolase [Pseudomonadota bacterium]